MWYLIDCVWYPHSTTQQEQTLVGISKVFLPTHLLNNGHSRYDFI